MYAIMTPAFVAIIVFEEIAAASAPTKLMVAVLSVFANVTIRLQLLSNDPMEGCEQRYDTARAGIGIRQEFPESAMGSVSGLGGGDYGCSNSRGAAGNLPVSEGARNCYRIFDANIVKK